MKVLLSFSLFSILIYFLSACSSNQSAHSKPHFKIPEIDILVSKMHQDYKKICLHPVLIRDVPDKNCAYRLFEAVEREAGTRYRDDDVYRIATQQYEIEVTKQIFRLLQKNTIKNLAKIHFDSKDQLLNYYLNLYALSP